MKALRILAALVLAAGACLTGRSLYLRAKAQLAGVLIRAAWERTLKTGRSQPPWPWADTHPAGRLRIPRLGYDEIVLEGATPRTLAFGPAHSLAGARLGEAGNVVLAGHRTSWFRKLEGVNQGDAIELEWYDVWRRAPRHAAYTVTAIRVVEPDDLSLLAPTPGQALTLITCYPFGASPRSPLRFVVRAAPTAFRAAR